MLAKVQKKSAKINELTRQKRLKKYFSFTYPAFKSVLEFPGSIRQF